MSQPVHTSVVHNHAKVRRTTRSSWIGFGVLALVVMVAPIAPYVISRGAQGSLVTLFSLTL